MNEDHLEIFKALSDATRHQILEFLSQVDECNVNELCEAFERLTQPTISHHLQILKRCSLVSSDRRGKMIYYSIRRGNMTQLMIEFRANFDLGQES